MMATRSTSNVEPCVVPLIVPRTQVRRVRYRHFATTFAKRASSRASAPKALTTELQLTATSLVEVRPRLIGGHDLSWEQLEKVSLRATQYVEQLGQTVRTRPTDDLIAAADSLAVLAGEAGTRAFTKDGGSVDCG